LYAGANLSAAKILYALISVAACGCSVVVVGAMFELLLRWIVDGCYVEKKERRMRWFIYV
jgi:hypothetical protein